MEKNWAQLVCQEIEKVGNENTVRLSEVNVKKIVFSSDAHCCCRHGCCL